MKVIKAVCECRQRRSIYHLVWQNIPFSYCSGEVGEFMIIERERMGPHKLGSLVIGMTANSTQRLQIFPSVYSSSVIVDFIEHD